LWIQVENFLLRDYGGDYDTFLEKNLVEAEAMSEKAVKVKELQKSQIKSKNKVSWRNQTTPQPIARWSY